MITPRRVIVAVTAGSLSAAFVTNAVWFATTTGTGRFEPVVGVLGIVAGITGLVAERWAVAREARDSTLAAIAAELKFNRELLVNEFVPHPDKPLRRTVYPRLHLSAVDAALVSGSLGRATDTELVGALHGWRNQVVRFNVQLGLAEVIAFTDKSEEPLQQLHDRLHRDQGPLPWLRTAVEDLLTRLDPSHVPAVPAVH